MRATAFSALVTLCFALSMPAFAADAPADQIRVAVMGIRNNDGVIRCGLYSSPEGFPKPGAQLRGVNGAIADRKATCVFDNVPAGKYAIAVFHAEHNEMTMQYGLFGIPKEGYGFSRNASGTFGPPDFSDAAFDYKGGSIDLSVALSY